MTVMRERDGSDQERFEVLLRGHAVMHLTASEREQLQALAAADPARRRMVTDFDRLHTDLARERALFATVASPADPVEEADEGFARLAAASASAEDELRGRLLHTPNVRVLRPHRRLARIGVVIAALAAAAVIATKLGVFSGPPALQQGTPRDERAGSVVAHIMIAPHVSMVDRSLSWSVVWHAQTYEVAVLDAVGNVVLQRAPEQARSTRWELTTEQIDDLRVRPELRLRVRAFDGSGLLVGATGDLPLQVQ